MSKKKKSKYSLKITEGSGLEYDDGALWWRKRHNGYTGVLHRDGKPILTLIGDSPEAVTNSANHRLSLWAQHERAHKNAEWVTL